jgi:basic membrane protein A and related proteins
MRQRRFLKGLAILLGLALVAAACGDDDDTTSDTTEADGGGAAATDFTACQVTDTGGVDDRSFNQTAYAGVH